MLSILNKNKLKKELNKPFKSESKHFPSSVREWDNSIYLYNKNNLNLIPYTTSFVMKLIKTFFNFYNKTLEKKIRNKRLLLRLKRLSSNKIFLSNGEFKHKNNNVLINIYVYNRQGYNYLYKMKNIYLKRFLSKSNIKTNFIKTLNLINEKGISNFKKINKDKFLLIKALNVVKNNKNYKINTLKSLYNYTILFYLKAFDLTIRKLRLYFIYKQLIHLNKSKFNYTYLRILKKHLENLFNKNVEFNLINLKRFYLNSDILSESIRLKISRNKRKMRRVLNKIRDKIKIHKKQIFLGFQFKNINTLKMIENKKLVRNTVFNSLKYKHITGFRLEAKGRLTKRYTASRSLSKIKYKGNLLNIDSSNRGLSSVILKGNLKSNIQYTKLKSKTRIGSFGIKGWISGN